MGRTDEFDSVKPTFVLPNAFATTAGNRNADGQGGLRVAVHQGMEPLKATSRVFLDNGSRQLYAILPDDAAGVLLHSLTR